MESLPGPAWLRLGPLLTLPNLSSSISLEMKNQPDLLPAIITFLISLTQWDYLSAHVWAKGMTHSVKSLNGKKIFHQNETFKETPSVLQAAFLEVAPQVSFGVRVAKLLRLWHL